MLNLKNDAVFRWSLQKKKSEVLNKISKKEGYFFGQHPLVEKSPTASGFYIYFEMNRKQNRASLLSYNCILGERDGSSRDH